MSKFKTLLINYDQQIAEVVINRPQAMNALNSEVLSELSRAFDGLAADNAVKVVILTGSGDKAFVAGADIAEMSKMNVEQGRSFAEQGQDLFLKIQQFPKPVIAAVNGFALGGGCELAMACDIRLASEKAKFGQPEVSLGIIPGFGGTQRLPRLVTTGMAKLLIFTGDMIDASEAYRIGLVQKVLPAGELMADVKAVARRIIARSAIAVGLAKTAINRGLDMDISTAMQYEAFIFGTCFAGEDQTEGMEAFLAKRKAVFSGQYAGATPQPK
jgi:enoyl-CoA hydratase